MTKEVLIRQYLLGSLPQDERTRLEDQYFADTALFEELIAVENDLIDSYIREELAPAEVTQFEAEFLSSPERRARVEFARNLRLARHEFSSVVHEHRFAPRKLSLPMFFRSFSTLQWASVAAALLLFAGGIWYFYPGQTRRASQPAAVASRGAESVNPLTAGPSAQGQPPTNNNVSMAMSQAPLTFTPEAGTVRGLSAGGNDLAIPAKPTTIVFLLPLTGKTYQEYRAELQTVEGHSVRVATGLAAQESDGQVVITFPVPSTSLESRDYILRLQAKTVRGRWEEIQAYSFRAINK